MARGRRLFSAACGALAAATCLRRGAFVQVPVRDRVAPLAAASAAAVFGLPRWRMRSAMLRRHSVSIRTPFAKAVGRNSRIHLQASRKLQPLVAFKAIDNMIVMGAQADPKLLMTAAGAHHKAIGSASGAGRLRCCDDVGATAKKLSDASCPFLKSVAIIVGTAADGGALKVAAEARREAIGSASTSRVTSAADYEAVNAALGRAVVSAPTSKVMGVFCAFVKIVPGTAPNNLFSAVDSGGGCRCQGVLRVHGRGEGAPPRRAPEAEAEELPGRALRLRGLAARAAAGGGRAAVAAAALGWARE
ncbi:unnamed protein product, partial [Prorocentrum cordatum]